MFNPITSSIFKGFTILILIISCSSNTEVANDKQSSWCYNNTPLASIEENENIIYNESERIIRSTFTTARALLYEEEGIPINIPTLREDLINDKKRALRFCKIWSDINDID